MDEPKPWKVGDECPACGSEMKKAPVPSDDERRRAEDREIRDSLPRHYDQANAHTIATQGTLYRCTRCRYASRVASTKKDRTERAA